MVIWVAPQFDSTNTAAVNISTLLVLSICVSISKKLVSRHGTAKAKNVHI